MTLPVYSGPVRLSLVESEDEESVRTVVRKLLADRCASEDVAAVYDGAQGPHGALWRTLAADLGLAGLLVPEEAGEPGRVRARPGPCWRNSARPSPRSPSSPVPSSPRAPWCG